MNKAIKKIFFVCILVIVFWIAIFVINYIKCINLKPPILMGETIIKTIILRKDTDGNEHSSVPHEYYGIGYRMESEIDKNNEIIINKMYLFDILINETNRYVFEEGK